MRPRSLVSGVLFVVAGAGVIVATAGPQARDIDGRARNVFQPAGKAGVLVFVMSDCPIANGYAPEIQRICDRAGMQGAACTLVYEDVAIDAAAVRTHLSQYRYRNITAVIDADRSLAERAKATVTPQAVVVAADGAVKYRGRIDNRYAALGKPRQVVTEHDLSDAIDAVISGRPVAHLETEAFGCFIPPRKGSQP